MKQVLVNKTQAQEKIASFVTSASNISPQKEPSANARTIPIEETSENKCISSDTTDKRWKKELECDIEVSKSDRNVCIRNLAARNYSEYSEPIKIKYPLDIFNTDSLTFLSKDPTIEYSPLYINISCSDQSDPMELQSLIYSHNTDSLTFFSEDWTIYLPPSHQDIEEMKQEITAMNLAIDKVIKGLASDSDNNHTQGDLIEPQYNSYDQQNDEHPSWPLSQSMGVGIVIIGLIGLIYYKTNNDVSEDDTSVD